MNNFWKSNHKKGNGKILVQPLVYGMLNDTSRTKRSVAMVVLITWNFITQA